MEKKKYYTIGEVSKMCDIPVKTLRYYDDIGLIKPNAKNSSTNYRYYEKEDILKLHKLKVFKSLKFSLAEIEGMISSDDFEFITKNVNNRLTALRGEIDELEATFRAAQNFLARLSQSRDLISSMNSDLSDIKCERVNLECIPELEVFSHRTFIHNYRNENINVEQWGKLFKVIKEQKAIQKGPITIIYHNQPMEQFYTNSCDYEIQIGVEVPQDFDKSQSFYSIEKPYLAATTLHFGGYDKLVYSYIKVLEWIRNNDYSVCGHIHDEFLISPIDTQNPNKYITKILVPIEKNH